MTTGYCWAYLRVAVLVRVRGGLRSGEQYVQRPPDDVKHQGFDKRTEGLLNQDP